MNKNNKGFTLLEVMIATALIGMVGLILASFLEFAGKSSKKVTDELSVLQDVLTLERVLLRDLKSAGSSFNAMKIKDDRGRLFFDLVTDNQDLTDKGPRDFTLKKGKNYFDLIVESDKFRSMIYSPATAYNVGAQPTNPMVAATLSFVSLNRNGIVRLTTQDTGNLWEAGNILMLDSPSTFRQVTPSGLDYSKPARSPIYLGYLRNSNSNMLANLGTYGIYDTSHPLKPNLNISSEDIFLRNVPGVGGGNPLVRLRKVQIVRYYLKDTEDGKLSIYKSMFDGAKFSGDILLAKGVKGLSFHRKKATEPLIEFKVIK